MIVPIHPVVISYQIDEAECRSETREQMEDWQIEKCEELGVEPRSEDNEEDI